MAQDERGVGLTTLYCLRCGSHRVELGTWKDSETATTVCYDCHTTGSVTGVCFGRLEVSEDVYRKSARDRSWRLKVRSNAPPWSLEDDDDKKAG